MGTLASNREEFEDAQHPRGGVVRVAINIGYARPVRAADIAATHSHFAEMEAVVVEEIRRRGHRRDRCEYIEKNARWDDANQ